MLRLRFCDRNEVEVGYLVIQTEGSRFERVLLMRHRNDVDLTDSHLVESIIPERICDRPHGLSVLTLQGYAGTIDPASLSIRDTTRDVRMRRSRAEDLLDKR